MEIHAGPHETSNEHSIDRQTISTYLVPILTQAMKLVNSIKAENFFSPHSPIWVPLGHYGALT